MNKCKFKVVYGRTIGQVLIKYVRKEMELHKLPQFRI